MSRTLICPCEDVTTEDIEGALAKGYRDVESIKRYTGFGTGICQGKTCLAQVASMVAASGRVEPEGVLPFTPRTPVLPTELSYFASIEVRDDLFPVEGVPASLGQPSHALRPEHPVPTKARIVIIGGGIMGLALAHNLAMRGETDVVVLDKGYLCAGASGRNGGGIRMQWGTEENVRLAQRSMELMKQFAGEHGINIWLRQGGYLFLAKTKEGAKRMERNVELHARCGVKTKLLSSEGAQELVPELTLEGIELSAYNPDDGVIFPWPFLWGYAQSCQKKGVPVETFTRVTGFDVRDGRVRRVLTDRGAIECETVVVAAGAWSPEVARLAGVELPNKPFRHEILSTEPLKPFLGPLVSVLDSGLYFSQSMRGELVGGMGDPNEPSGLQMGSTLRFVSRFSTALLQQLPVLGHVKVLRQWAGCYDVTPDHRPILGETPGLPNMLQVSGFVGHGFMMAPAVAERMAAWMLNDTRDEMFTRFNLDRFERGELEREEMIIG